MELREYQKDAIARLRQAVGSGKKRVILQASCGAGKTIISAEIAKCAVEKGKQVLFLVNRRDLVKQTVDKYTAYGLGDQTGIILAGEEPSLSRPIQCASFQTYGRRIKLDEFTCNPWFHKADLIIWDEAQSANAPTYRKIIECYGNKPIIGLSATPMGANSTGLGDVFEEIVTCVPTSILVGLGHLVPAIHYSPSKPDLARIGVMAGDYNKKQLGERVDKPKLVGDILENWQRLASDRQTIIFATNVKHSKHIRDRFRAYGVTIEHIDAHTDDEERQRIYSGFESGDIQIITNVGVCCEGSDLPVASCICVAKPTLQIGRWIQMAGRGARPYPGKKDYLLLDFSGCVERHGFVDDEIEWSLDVDKPAATKKRQKKEKKEPHIMICEMCSFAFTGRRCPQCGKEVADYGKKVAALEADLVCCDKPKAEKFTQADKRLFWRMLEHWRATHTKKDGSAISPGWSSHKFKENFGCWPKGLKGLPPVEPDVNFINRMKYLNIKNAKRREKEANETAIR